MTQKETRKAEIEGMKRMAEINTARKTEEDERLMRSMREDATRRTEAHRQTLPLTLQKQLAVRDQSAQ